MEHEADVPQDEEGQDGGDRGERRSAGAEDSSEALEENAEAENKEDSERDEKAVAVRRDARPVGVTRDEKIESQEGGEERSADARLAPAEENQSGNSEKKDGGPGKQAMIGSEEHVEEGRRAPEPISERDVARLECSAVEDIARDKGGQQTDEHDRTEEEVTHEQIGKARCFGSTATRAAAEGGQILGHRFKDENGQHHGVRVIYVEHEAGDESEQQPLRQSTRGTRLMPIPEEESDGKSRMRVRPRGIEIHVDGKRAGPPDGEGGKERPALLNILARQAEGKEQAEKSVDGSGEGHGDAVRSGKSVGGNGRTEGAREKDASMRDEQKRRPKNRGANGEMVVEVASGSSKVGSGLAAFVEARPAKTFVGMAVIFGEIEIVLDKWSTGKSVIPDAVTTHPGVEERQR